MSKYVSMCGRVRTAAEAHSSEPLKTVLYPVRGHSVHRTTYVHALGHGEAAFTLSHQLSEFVDSKVSQKGYIVCLQLCTGRLRPMFCLSAPVVDFVMVVNVK
jgi:hypothetical protein